MALLLKVALLCAAAHAANTGGGSSNPDPLKNKDGSVYKEEFGRVHAQGVNMIQRASQLHDATYHRQGKTEGDGGLPTRRAQRGRREVESTEPQYIIIGADDDSFQKVTLCEGSRADWRDGMAQCLHQLTGLRVIVHNDDGTCADCGSLQRKTCITSGDPPPGLVVVLGGGEDKRLRFLCANHYCGNTGDPFWVDAGRNAPHD